MRCADPGGIVLGMDDETTARDGVAAWLAALPEWGNLGGGKRVAEHGPEIDGVRGVLARLDAAGIAALARHWRSLAAEREAMVEGWRALCGTWNGDMNSSFGGCGWEDEAYEPKVRVIEAIGSMLERAGAVGMSLPDQAVIRAFALAFELAGHGNRRPAVADFAGSLEGGPEAWAAALTCAGAISVADTSVRPGALVSCLSGMLALDPAEEGQEGLRP